MGTQDRLHRIAFPDAARSQTHEVRVFGFILIFLTAMLMAGASFLMKTGIARASGFEFSLSSLLGVLCQPMFVSGFLLAGIGALMWFRVLATQKLSTCYPLFVGLTFILITFGSFYFLNEKISAQKLAGLAVIMLGITAVARG